MQTLVLCSAGASVIAETSGRIANTVAFEGIRDLRTLDGVRVIVGKLILMTP